MRVTFFDIETAPIIAAVWGLYDQNIPYHHVVHEWFIICASWQVLGSERIASTSVLDDEKRFADDHRDDFHVVQRLCKMIDSTDVLVAHNIKFDWGKFMARVVFHDLTPPKKPILVDTLREARKYKFTSNKLDDLGALLDTGRKIKLNPGEFVLCALGNKPAIRRMVKYNRGDLPPLVKLYTRLEKYSASYPNIAILKHGVLCCPSCLSSDLQSRGVQKIKSDNFYTATAAYRRYQCLDCLKWCRETKAFSRSRLKPA